MCTFDDGFKLCTCENIETSFGGYVWVLYFLDWRDFEVGRWAPPEDIGSGLDEEWVLLNLNCENCFDFDYQAKNGDRLLLYKAEHRLSSNFLAFDYSEGSWHYGIGVNGEPKKPMYKGKVCQQ